jgi:hypothetical protein
MGSIVIDLFLGACRHRHQSRPFTLDKQTYRACLDCGEEIGYSLERMASCRFARCSEALSITAPPVQGPGHLMTQTSTKQILCGNIAGRTLLAFGGQLLPPYLLY